LADGDHGPAAVRQTTRLDFGSEGLPLNQLDDVMQALRAQSSDSPRSGSPARAAKVGRNAPCPCGSPDKVKKGFGAPLAGSYRGAVAREPSHPSDVAQILPVRSWQRWP